WCWWFSFARTVTLASGTPQISVQLSVAKPDRHIYEMAAKQVGARADRCLFVDDRDENIEAAHELGMTTVLYRTVDDLRRALAGLLNSCS
ncbi:HAD-IA family hydrolase, partial [Streptomyces purpureus]